MLGTNSIGTIPLGINPKIVTVFISFEDIFFQLEVNIVTLQIMNLIRLPRELNIVTMQEINKTSLLTTNKNSADTTINLISRNT